jgi:hypothetical protein
MIKDGLFNRWHLILPTSSVGGFVLDY